MLAEQAKWVTQGAPAVKKNKNLSLYIKEKERGGEGKEWWLDKVDHGVQQQRGEEGGKTE